MQNTTYCTRNIIMLSFDTPISDLTRVGKTTAGKLKKLGLEKALDLLWHFPRTYEDFSRILPIKEAQPGQKVTIEAQVELIHTKRSPLKRMYVTEALLTDKTDQLKAVWFNQPYITTVLKNGDRVFVAGTLQSDLFAKQLVNPVYEKVGKETIHTGRIVPLYPLTHGLTQKQLRFLIKQVIPLAEKIKDYLPPWLKEKYHLVDLAKALKHIHFPTTKEIFLAARTRLQFDELFLTLLNVQRAKMLIKQAHAPAIPFQWKLVKQFVDSLPFILTPSQKKAAWDILQDLEAPHPMNRMLEGDVGSGKTVVAAIAILNTVSQKYQAILLAPTEILARQHFHTFQKLYAQQNISLALLTRTDKKICELFGKKGTREPNETATTKKNLLQQIKSGKTQLIIGTHALLQESAVFDHVGLVVVDEQHRFGVEQRKSLKDKTPDTVPHFLSMTATPIPRSLALTLYGDLDISLMTDMPKNRKPIITRIVPPHKRDDAYGFIRQHISQGNQAFVICPLIEESDKLGIASATNEHEKLTTKIFPDLQVGLVHGRLPKQGKEKVMQDFRRKRLDILVATAVVEVGIDIPDATIMMIEGAERFGLAQLHQFRGRVGRSDKQSYCLLFTDSANEKIRKRLQAMRQSKSGFELAEYDLTFRGPGEIYGSKQSGLPEFKIATLADIKLIQQAKQAAQELLKKDPDLKNLAELKKKIEQEAQEIHFE